VRKPAYTALAGGVKIATSVPGSGPEIQSGQTASVLYTGYLARNGHLFDDSINDGGTPFSFTLGAGEVIPGFDEGTVGMQVGETRIVMIPPAEGYGPTANGPIPGNSTLIFVLTLESIS
jgi:FKBP-type peptidyl-prolyl cis-trans isomerase